jgi:GT2 family glycosyltransferase
LSNIVPIAVVIPTYSRALKVCSVLERLEACHPKPAEIWLHVDCADGAIEAEVRRRFPTVAILTSRDRLGPGGGRHRCLLACSTPYAVSFDDDSYPADSDFFLRVEQLFRECPRAAIIGASISLRNEQAKHLTGSLVEKRNYVGCGFAIRLSAYRQIRGFLPRPIAYGMEESDISLQLLAAGWQIFEAGSLRVRHDTEFDHRYSREIVSATITNVGLCAYLHFPLSAWPCAVARVSKIVLYCLRNGQFRGVCSGIINIPIECYRNRRFRKPVGWRTLWNALQTGGRA